MLSDKTINNFYEITKRDQIETKTFEDASPFALGLRSVIKPVIINLSDPEFRDVYASQLDLACRNLEITVETLIKLFFFHPIKNALVLSTAGNWILTYFTTQKETKNLDKYYVYTQYDNHIPFYPEEDIMYTYMISQISYFSNELAQILSSRDMHYLSSCFIELNNLGTDTHKKFQTLMPRFNQHNRISLKIIQNIDKPYNCCPSLHIAYTLFLDNAIEKLFYYNFRSHSTKRFRTFESIRYSSMRMFNSVLYTKQHSIIDVAFGMLSSYIIFEKKYNFKFNNLINTFNDLKKDNPDINYDIIQKVYMEAMEIYLKKKEFYDKNPEYALCEQLSVEGISFRETVGDYLKQNGYIKLPANYVVKEGTYFDTIKKQLMHE